MNSSLTSSLLAVFLFLVRLRSSVSKNVATQIDESSIDLPRTEATLKKEWNGANHFLAKSNVTYGSNDEDLKILNDFPSHLRKTSKNTDKSSRNEENSIWRGDYVKPQKQQENNQSKENIYSMDRRRNKRSVTEKDHDRRHAKRFHEEIEGLESELSLVEENLKEIQEKEDNLETDVDELRTVSDMFQSHQEGDKLYEESDERPVGTLDFSRDDTQLNIISDADSVFNRKHLSGNERKARREVKALRKRYERLLNRNRELRKKNEELCRDLYTIIRSQEERHPLPESDEFNSRYRETSSSSFDSFRIVRILDGLKAGRSCIKYIDMRVRQHKTGIHHHRDEESDATRSGKKSDEAVSKQHNLMRNYHIQDGKYSGSRDPQDSENMELEERPEQKERYEEDSEMNLSESDKHYQQKGSAHHRKHHHSDADLQSEDHTDDFSSQIDGRKMYPRLSSMDESSETSRNAEIMTSEQQTSSTDIAHSTSEEDKEKAFDHVMSVDEAVFCDKPVPTVIYPADLYPHPKKYYTPQGTILHRCGSHAGCCPSEQLTCVPAKKEVVDLHFFAAVIDESKPSLPHVEKLSFVNHTKCGCVFKHHAKFYL